MRGVLVDAGPLVAVLDESDADHQRCVSVLKRLSDPMITTWPVVTEAMALLGQTQPPSTHKSLFSPARSRNRAGCGASA